MRAISATALARGHHVVGYVRNPARLGRCGSGTAAVITVMLAAGARRLVVLSDASYGAHLRGASRLHRVRAANSRGVSPRIRRRLAQDRAVAGSGLAWTMERPAGRPPDANLAPVISKRSTTTPRSSATSTCRQPSRELLG